MISTLQASSFAEVKALHQVADPAHSTSSACPPSGTSLAAISGPPLAGQVSFNFKCAEHNICCTSSILSTVHRCNHGAETEGSIYTGQALKFQILHITPDCGVLLGLDKVSTDVPPVVEPCHENAFSCWHQLQPDNVLLLG